MNSKDLMSKYEAYAKEKGLTLEDMITLAKSQIATAAENVRLQGLVRKMARWIGTGDFYDDICTAEKNLNCDTDCVPCIIKHFEGVE